MLNNDLNDIFENVGKTYYFKTQNGYDNMASMGIFIDNISDIGVSNIYIDYGTLVVLQLDRYDYMVRLDSGGDGDFCSHKIETSIYVE